MQSSYLKLQPPVKKLTQLKSASHHLSKQNAFTVKFHNKYHWKNWLTKSMHSKLKNLKFQRNKTTTNKSPQTIKLTLLLYRKFRKKMKADT